MFFANQRPNPEGVDYPAEVKQQRSNLYILAIAHFAVAVTLTVALPGVGVGEIFIAMFLMCFAYSMNFCLIMFYMIIMIFDLV